MFGLFRRSKKDESSESISSISNSTIDSVKSTEVESDARLIAVISAAITRFREAEGAKLSDAGFIVRRIRRV